VTANGSPLAGVAASGDDGAGTDSADEFPPGAVAPTAGSTTTADPHLRRFNLENRFELSPFIHPLCTSFPSIASRASCGPSTILSTFVSRFAQTLQTLPCYLPPGLTNHRQAAVTPKPDHQDCHGHLTGALHVQRGDGHRSWVPYPACLYRQGAYSALGCEFLFFFFIEGPFGWFKSEEDAPPLSLVVESNRMGADRNMHVHYCMPSAFRASSGRRTTLLASRAYSTARVASTDSRPNEGSRLTHGGSLPFPRSVGLGPFPLAADHTMLLSVITGGYAARGGRICAAPARRARR
jgi:hypothetical protein